MKLTDKFEFIKNKPARNRIVMPPMDTLMANDGFANEFHIQHYGARSYGGTGTIIIESTAVQENGRIREKDLGLWKDAHIEPFKHVVKAIKLGGALAGVQLNHAGAKAELKINTVGATNFYDYIDQTNFSLLTVEQLADIKTSFIKAAKRAQEAGFDFVELHAAHGYLLSEILSKKINEVTNDQDILKRAKIIIEIVDAINQDIKIPVAIRFSISDHSNDGMKVEDFVPLLKALENKVVYFHISSGEVISRVDIPKVIQEAGTKLFRIPLALKVKQAVATPVIAVGNFDSRKDVDSAISLGIDAVAIGREHLFNPNIVVNTLLTTEEVDEKLYHWNNNIWFNYKGYKTLKDHLDS
ncbi:oxidoreductase [Spiroplasma platyhelix]|uniref:NADH:flavin oxidoreductase/NADH oxidase N-terminal domain-containing protein n=1 Tax=Spiroplasma platyhelix PALS-1 TaxID=1276218 RepID=A0A846TTC1_9MOLU|nr:tRNA-dihydrouridine synthase [Spiroplasma platyhelix]MBE4704383.1 NADPH dehydrogenase [Spiroplasma platyhelix PALS-1]NKE38755.1 hypothetical protein [Spiroplasma platyhelix PALS-1]UJB28966.1 hypothetical protein SPLAT_v1c02010 [Spiroplasma platyhelix PALS-1]